MPIEKSSVRPLIEGLDSAAVPCVNEMRRVKLRAAKNNSTGIGQVVGWGEGVETFPSIAKMIFHS